jgi:uncharacterized protein YraI
MRTFGTLAMKSLLGVALALPVAAHAATAYTNANVNMRAGPNPEFPLVATIPAGAPVYVNGCIAGYTWCDVTVNGYDRGWIYADYLSYPYQNQPVTIISGGPTLGLPIVTFSIGNYWDSYYRQRPWYSNRGYWYARPSNWWYRDPPRYYSRPVVRPYPGGRWDNDRRWHDDRRWDDSRRWSDSGRRWDNNDRRWDNDRRGNDNRPRVDARPRGGGETTLRELNREARRTEDARRVAPSGNVYSQPSAGGYSQQ